jgi:hypothetical protein
MLGGVGRALTTAALDSLLLVEASKLLATAPEEGDLVLVELTDSS